MKKYEIIKNHKIQVYDNPEYIDRYTVIFLNCEEYSGKFTCLGVSENLFFTQHSQAMPGKHNGKRILFDSLPEKIKNYITEYELNPDA